MVILDIKDEKADFVMELFKNLRFVKMTPLTEAKAQHYLDLKEAFEEIKLIEAGEKRGRPIQDLLDEL